MKWPSLTYRQAKCAYKKQRERLHRENPHCHWCGKLTYLPSDPRGMGQTHRMATIDHLYPRGHPKRLDGNPNAERRRVLSCRRCNNGRGNPYVVPKLPKSLEDAWRGAGMFERMCLQHGALPSEL